MRSPARGPYDGTHGALTTRLDQTRGPLEHDREIRVEQRPMLAHQAAEAVAMGFDLLVVVADQGQVVRRLRDGRREMEEHRDTGLHVRRAAAVHPITVYSGR